MDRTKHLEFIQNIISRMANNSFILKGWAVTLITGIIGFSLTNDVNIFIYLALLPALIFWGLDAYYLRQERLFRELYIYSIKKRLKNSEQFSLDTSLIKNNVDSWLSTLFDKRLLVLYGTIIVVIIITAVIGG